MNSPLQRDVNSYARPRFALRTIRGGAARIHGHTFRPDERHMAYDGRLDGQRYAFGLYYDPDGEMLDFVSLWGTEGFYRDPDGEWPGPECIDGHFNWAWWRSAK